MTEETAFDIYKLTFSFTYYVQLKMQTRIDNSRERRRATLKDDNHEMYKKFVQTLFDEYK